MSIRDKLRVIVKKSSVDDLAATLLDPKVNLADALEIINTKGETQNALGKAITIFLTLYFAGLDHKLCGIIAIIIFFWDIGPVLLRNHRKAAAIAKILTLLAVGRVTGSGTTGVVLQDLKEALRDGVITKEEFLKIIRDIINKDRTITIEKKG